MRKSFIAAIVFSAFLSVPALSQRFEIFGGAQYEHLQPSYNAVGWNASFTANLNSVLGFTGDFSGVYKSKTISTSAHTYTFGPALTLHTPVFQPFVHSLFGVATSSVGGTNSSAFAMFLGGGLDIGLRKGVGVRLPQVDWLFTEFGSHHQTHQVRISAGVVVKF
jgi:hypothetical protein